MFSTEIDALLIIASFVSGMAATGSIIDLGI